MIPKLILIYEKTPSKEKDIFKGKLKESTQSLKPKHVKPSSNSTSVFIPDKRRKEGLAFQKDVKKDPSKRQSFKIAFQKCHGSKRFGLGYEPQVVDNVCNKVRTKHQTFDAFCNDKLYYFTDYLCGGSFYSIESFSSKPHKKKRNASPKVFREKKLFVRNKTVTTNPKEPIMQ